MIEAATRAEQQSNGVAMLHQIGGNADLASLERRSVTVSTDNPAGQQEKALDLLRKLASDDDVRARFMSDAKSVLVEFGIAHSDSDIPRTVALASKELLTAELEKVDEEVKSSKLGLIILLALR